MTQQPQPPASGSGGSGDATAVRLQLSPAATAEHVDGAWWPRSRHLAAELPVLLDALAARLDDPVLVGYHRSAWDPAPDTWEWGRGVVRLQGFGSHDPPTVLLLGADGRGVSLLVVPPETGEQTARQALATPSGSDAGGAVGGSASEAGRSEARSLAEVAARLTHRYAVGDPERAAMIKRWVAEAAGQFRDAPIQAFVPILVEHIVRGRLRDGRAVR